MAFLLDLPSDLLRIWKHLCGGDLVFSVHPEPPQPGMKLSIPVIYQGKTYGWLHAAPLTDKEGIALPILESWAGLLGGSTGERQVSDGLTNQVITAWDRLTFLHQVTQLIRTQTDSWQRCIAALKLAASTIQVENAFVAHVGSDGLVTQWLRPLYQDAALDPVLTVLQSRSDTLVCDSRSECQSILSGIPGARGLVGRQLSVVTGPPTWIGLINPLRGHFDAGDIQLFESLAEQITTVIEVEALHTRRIEAEQLGIELDLAAHIQNSFLPSHAPRVADYQFAASLVSASRISGDFYDVYSSGNGVTWLLVCDVAGKGISAALLATEVRAIIRAEGAQSGEPGEVLRQSNVHIYEDMSRVERFATAILVALPDGNAVPLYASAGHTTAFWVHAEPLRVELLPSTTLPLGVLPEIDSVSHPVAFEPDDVLLMYTDGLTEIENKNGKILGRAGVMDVLLATHRAPAQFILDSLLERHERHRGGVPVSDDLTLLVIKRQPENAGAARWLKRLHLTGGFASLAEAETAMEDLRAYLPATDEASTWLMAVQLALTEVITNIVKYAYARRSGDIHGLIALHNERLEMDLFDVGEPYEVREILPLEYPSDAPPEGGYGLHIVNTVMDSVLYQRLPNGYNHWYFTCQLPTG